MKLSSIILEQELETQNISADQAFAIYNFLKKRLHQPALDAGLRMSVFEQEFPIASAFYTEIGGMNESIDEGLLDRLGKIEIMYTDRGRLYAVKVEDSEGNRLGKLHVDDTNDLLQQLKIKDKITQSLDSSQEKVLDSIVKQLQAQGIEASWDDSMDVS